MQTDIETKLHTRLSLLQHRDKNISLQGEGSKAWIKANLSLIGVPASNLDLCTQILEYMGDLKVIWLHLQECTGCSESFLRTHSPSFETLIFDLFKIEYHDLIMQPSGLHAIKTLNDTVLNDDYILLVEGSIPMGSAKDYLTIGNKNALDEIRHIIGNAKAVFAIGTCSSFGGIQSAYPSPTNGHAISEIFSNDKEEGEKFYINAPIINVPGCPPSDRNIIGSLMYYYLFVNSPLLDDLKRPTFAYSKTVHDLCERKSFFMSGDFVESFHDENMKKGYCLYKVGCKCPYAFNNCPKVKFNARTSWPVQAGHGCIACSEANFWDNFGKFEKPMSNDTFFTLNKTFLDKTPGTFLDSRITDIATIPNIRDKDSLLKVDINELDSTCILFDINGLYDNSNATTILLRDKGEIRELSKFAFEINPKVILQSYASKNKQGKRLYENYQKAFSTRHESIMSLSEESYISNNINDLFIMFLIILDKDRIESKYIDSINAFIRADDKSALRGRLLAIYDLARLASEFKFPYASDLVFKMGQNNGLLNLDIAKAISIGMSYAIGGLDIYGISYSVLCGVMHSISEALAQYDCDVILQGDIFTYDLCKKVFLKHNRLLAIAN